MRVPTTLLLIAFSFLAKASLAEDIYWDDNNDLAHEFLEVDHDVGINGNLRRLKRQFWNLFSPQVDENNGEDEDDAVDEDDSIDNDPTGGSGLSETETETETETEREAEVDSKERTIRVTFVVMEPYQLAYSDRDSLQFRNFSKSLADSVNKVFRDLPGTHRASLVRIQSRLADAFSCKVTVDISTTSEDPNQISETLREYIRNKRMLGNVSVNDNDFSVTDLETGYIPSSDVCAADQLRCSDGRCLPVSTRCNGVIDCSGGDDEQNCPPTEPVEPNREQDYTDENPWYYDKTTTAASQGSPYVENPVEETTSYKRDEVTTASPGGFTPNYESFEGRSEAPESEVPESKVCWDGAIRCDETRCLLATQRCDQVVDCDDGTDEMGCPEENCGVDDFRCPTSGQCIESARRCDRIYDCPNGEDERDCECRPDEFQCVEDGSCIESRKRCDNIDHCTDRSDEVGCVSQLLYWSGHHVCKDRGKFLCKDGSCISILLRCDGFRDCPRDGSDELECPCSSDQWQCDHGNCIKRNKRCNGRVDCPTDRSDERNCIANGYFKCRTGKLIPEYQRCNRRYDCDHGDYSDEQNCPCGDGDYKCDNGYCVPASKKCDRTHDCQDGSDERDCTYGSVCMAYQYKCSSGQCIPADSRCNGTRECIDGSDEKNCPCKRGQFQCHDGTCINFSMRCNGHGDCHPSGEDELNCGVPRCEPDKFTCDLGSLVPCATRCDGVRECDAGEDEDDCDDCGHLCDGGICIKASQVCDQNADCADGSDEEDCGEDCDGPNDFRCQNGECLNVALRCNGFNECSDSSDELNCNITTSPPHACKANEYQCRDGMCINGAFFCDKNQDCNDNSDEENCPWLMARPSRMQIETTPCHESEFTCYNGRCIPHLRRCDNIYDCSDFSDEQNCYSSACDEGYWQCLSGQCIPLNGYCDGVSDCIDRSDERDCQITTTSFPTVFPPFSLPPSTTRPIYIPPESRPEEGCGRNEWRCENGPCIDVLQRCDGHIDCPRDGSDEFDCPAGSPIALNVKTYPEEQSVRYGGDVVFSCRDEGPIRAPVRWVREGGRPLKSGTIDRKGRLEMSNVTLSDSGVYICQVPRYLGSPGSEIKVVLNVEKPKLIEQRPTFVPCPSNQRTCGSGQCISSTAVCNGVIDCSDGSDEDYCHGSCEPNEFRCDNRKCVLKTWLCDADDDCGDGSDEQNCGPLVPGQQCSPVEFACATNDQCVLKSFHCDGQSDCFDGSDEIGCASVSIRKQPSPSNVKLNPGDTLTLFCEAVGVPTPLISWRLNWGNVPEQCTFTSVQGSGVLTCPNMQPEHSGAYSCEGMNNKGTVFAAPDAIVYVNRTGNICPAGYFNSEARSESECIRCFCFGKSTQCQSADLFIFNMPTPLGEGGTRLVGVSQDYNGNIQKDQQIDNQYYYLPLRNGATVTKLAGFSSPWSRNTDIHPYISLPETYNDNQLTSYGGSIKYRLSPHNPQSYGDRDNIPDIIILGKYQNLVHHSRTDRSRDLYINARLTPGNWQKPSSRGLVPASREDIMMTLDDIDIILLRADLNNAGVNISDFTMESAQLLNVGLGAASLVEECVCPKGYKGRSCEKCADGYELQNTGPWNGACVAKAPCPPMTYGDPNSGGDCRPCPCPLTNRGNQFASGCSVGPRGNVVCDCLPGYEGSDCSYCAAGYVGMPLLPGDACRPREPDNCNPIGTIQVRPGDECVCKDNVQGRYCDQCTNGSFYLSKDFRNGCAQCFCTGVSTQCVSSNLRRRTTTVRFNVPEVVDHLKVYKSAPIGPAGDVRYITPTETDLRPTLFSGDINLDDISRSGPSIFYWSLQDSFAGDMVTSYGGYLTYQLRNVQTNPSLRNTAADVQLISDNSLTFHHYGNFAPTSDGFLNASVQFLESGWQRSDGKQIVREQFLLALADVKTILIKATYSSDTDVATIESASIQTADEYGDGPMAQHVEQCVCPAGYIGTSCEDCAPGYTRGSGGLYLEYCDLCDCNGHSNNCHPETGQCLNCDANTDGPNCEYCRDGYERDVNNNCVPGSQTRPPQTCNCDSRGEAVPCDTQGYCVCKQNVEGDACDRCRPGTFRLDASNPLGCTACYCSGVTTDCHEANYYSRISLPAPIFGENYGGYALMDLNAERVINDQFVPVIDQSELMYVFSDQPIGDLYWSLPSFSGNRVLSYGGTLSLTQKFKTSGYPDTSSPGTDVILVGEGLSVFWTNPNSIRSDEALSYQVPLRENGWYILNSNTPANRQDFMSVLKNLKRILVRATLTRENIISTSIADVSLDSAAISYDSTSRVAKDVEECICPEGYIGTSCESCAVGYYKDRRGYCSQCNCNGHDCQLGGFNEVICNCRPPYTGPDCSTVGLIMELHPTIHDGYSNSTMVGVTFTCKYRAPEPLTIKFYSGGLEIQPSKQYTESKLYKDGWRGEHVWSTIWDTGNQEQVYECRTITKGGFVLGVLSTTLPEKGGDSMGEITTRPPPTQSTIVVKIITPTLKIQEVGSTVNFTCQARSQMVKGRLRVNWSKADGYLPLDRTQIDESNGVLIITNLQVSDSGKYTCEANDGINTGQAYATLKVPSNDMTPPTVSINPSVKEYMEGSTIELTCSVEGNPAPRITWQRTSNRALPRSSQTYDALLIIENAQVEDSGEYRCTATNAAGTANRIAVITVRPVRMQEKLKVSSSAPTLDEGQSTRVVCTGTSNEPAGTIDWIRQDGTDFLSNVRSDNGVLYIDVARLENQGVYICQTGSPDVNPVLVVLTVIPTKTLTPGEATNITLSVNRLSIAAGDRGTIDCTPRGLIPPLIKWSKHQDSFGPGTSQRENTLIITNAQESDAGYYLCEGMIDGRPVVSGYVFVDIEKREKAQVVIYPQVENFANLGSEYQLHCYVTGGNPPPVVTWDRNGGRPFSPQVQIQQNNILRFQNIDVNDEGEYTCTATNEAGSVSATAILKVRSPPTISIRPDYYTQASRGNRVNIECRGEGYPKPEVSIKSSSGHVLVPPTQGMAVLNIPSLSDSDDGIYFCSASSPAGNIEEQFAIRVERGDIVRDEDDENAPGVMKAIEYRDARIRCNASDDFSVLWERADKRSLQYNARQSGKELIISNTTKSDAGEYKCTLINRRTNEAQQSVYINLEVIAPPRLAIRPRSQTVRPGQSPKVECHVEGDDIISITWRPINKTPSSRVQYQGPILTFRHIEVEDAGEYECFAMNSVANATGIAEVIVEEDTGRGTVESYDHEQFAHVGAAVHLSCNVSQPDVRIRWTKDGRSVPRSISQKTDGSLFIRLAQKSDSGHYVCLIRDPYGRQTTNYINLHIEGFECLDMQFHCYDDSSCIDEDLLCDGYSDCLDSSDENNCILRRKRLSKTLLDPNSIPTGTRDEAAALVAIDQPRRPFRVGENVQVLCRGKSSDISIRWEKYDTNQYVETKRYGDGLLLVIPEVQEVDAGAYRCTGVDRYRLTSYDDLNLEVIPGPNEPFYPVNDRNTTYTARLGDIVDLPCNHNLEEPVTFEWRREYSQLPPGIRPSDRNLHLNGVTEADAGTYVCQVRNNRATTKARATLRVTGIIPKFDGNAWLALPPLRDAYMKFDIEISFNPSDHNGVILYNSENDNGVGDYVILELVNGVPRLTVKFTPTPLIVNGDRPLQLNTWHTIRLSKSNSRVSMDVDDTGPFVVDYSEEYHILDLNAPLYIGGIPDMRPPELAQAVGFAGCISMLILGKEETNIMTIKTDEYNVQSCDSCISNQCLNGAVCQEARNERGYICLCPSGYAGLYCDHIGEACRPGLCGPGKCTDTIDGYKCACPVTYIGKNCEVKQNIDYPAFTGSAYLAIKPPHISRLLYMSMMIKAKSPVTDGIIMYCAQSPRGYGGFTSLAVHDGRLEFRYDVGDGNPAIILVSDRLLQPDVWTDVKIERVGHAVSMKIDVTHSYDANLTSAKELNFETPMFVGGVDDSIILNNNTGVTGGFSGCIKDVSLYGDQLDLINASIDSANVQECVTYNQDQRGDIPGITCSQCQNGGYCLNTDDNYCKCPYGFDGIYCENHVPVTTRPQIDPCMMQPCKNGGSCKIDRSTQMNYTCDCPLGFAGSNCQMRLDLLQSVGFNGNGYLELPAAFLRYDLPDVDYVLIAIAFHTTKDGVLLYQKEAQSGYRGDYILLRVENGLVVLDWDLGDGDNNLSVNDVLVTDGERHQIIVKLYNDKQMELTVDTESNTATSSGLSNVMNADSNIYIGGIPDYLNTESYPGLVGCIEHVEFYGDRSIQLGKSAVAGRNTQRCKE